MQRLQLLMAGLTLGLALSVPQVSHADIATTGDSGEPSDDDDDGCTKRSMAPASLASLALGLGLVAAQRRRDRDA